MLNQIIRFFLVNKLVAALLAAGFIIVGLIHAPFFSGDGLLSSKPVAVDAIPDIGENQQIVFTAKAGWSPRDIEDQITYPLTSYLLGIPGVKSVRSNSMPDFSAVYIIFDDDMDFYESRSRITEKLNSIPANLLPEGVSPALGPDATALGQVFWYTIEGRDENGNVTGGWDLNEIRSVQDYYVKYGLNAAEGVSEVASIGGHVKEYQIDVDPAALQKYNVPITKVARAVQSANRDVGAKTLEINQVEYLVRGIGTLKSVHDVENIVVQSKGHTPLRIKDIAKVNLGPQERRGALDRDGAEVVGGVVVARFGANPLNVIENTKKKIAELEPGMPEKVLADGTRSKLTIVPFYDRSHLIRETLGTLQDALSLQVLITILVIVVMILNLRTSFVISSVMPISVLAVFIAMYYLGVDANIVSLSGIAISIGTLIDLGVILTENILKHIEEKTGKSMLENVYNGAAEVSGAILTAVTTTIVSFIPVFTLQAAEGKLFFPLAFTKTFALLAALPVTLLLLPVAVHILFNIKPRGNTYKYVLNGLLTLVGLIVLILGYSWAGITLTLIGAANLVTLFAGEKAGWLKHSPFVITAVAVSWLLAVEWLPLGPSVSTFSNYVFVLLALTLILGVMLLIKHYYEGLLRFLLRHKTAFLVVPAGLIILALHIWLGAQTVLKPLTYVAQAVGWNIEDSRPFKKLDEAFPGTGKEFMPSLDEGSFLLMPTTMPHAGFSKAQEIMELIDMAVSQIPEVEETIGKLGRVESALDPAPVSMYENVINYLPEYAVNDRGNRTRYAVTASGDYLFVLQNGDTAVLSAQKDWVLTKNKDTVHLNVNMRPLDKAPEVKRALSNVADRLIEDVNGKFYRHWRPHIQSPDDIWDEITKAVKIPGLTSAPKLQPIETRQVMLQTGMRAPMGVKVFGPDLETIEDFAIKVEEILKSVPQVKQQAVFADRIVGKPYIIADINRENAARYGLNSDDIWAVFETAAGGMPITQTLEGRERYPVRLRYPRELRNTPEKMERILVPTPAGAQIPLGSVLDIRYERGPQSIKSENTFITGYVIFDRAPGIAETDAVEAARDQLNKHIENGSLTVPPGISFNFSGNYENQVRAEERLSYVVPAVLIIIFIILYLQFRSVPVSLMVFTGVAVAFSGGFILIWLYGMDGFMDFSLFGQNQRQLFNITTVNLSVAVWVGFIALFGIATDDGVLMATYLNQTFKENEFKNSSDVREAVVKGALKRIRPAAITSATTLIALLPVITSTGRGADIMIPMAIPAFGGMIVASVSWFTVPVLYEILEQIKLKNKAKQ